MPETVSNCLLCGAQTSQLFDSRSFEGRQVENRICQTCGFVFQSPRMTELENQQFYSTEYRQLYQGSSGPNPKDLAIQQLRAGYLASFIKEQFRDVTRHLDIGCSAGLLLQAFNQVYGCKSVGIEPGIAYREFAARTGFKIYPSLQDLQHASEPRFDLISMAHVLEHIPDPLAYLIALREKHLAHEGRLLIEVPNLFMHDSFEVAHLSSFSGHTLIQMIQKAGFEVISLKKHGRPRSRILPYYLLLFCCPSSSDKGYILRRERIVGFKRKISFLYRRLVSRLFPNLAWQELSDEKGQVEKL